MIVKVLAVVALVCAILALFGIGIETLGAVKLLAVGLGALAVAVLL